MIRSFLRAVSPLADFSLAPPQGQKPAGGFISALTLSLLAVIVLLPLTACAGRSPLSGSDPFPESDLERTTINGPLRSRLQIDKGVVSTGSKASLEATFEIRNIQQEPLKIEFASGQQYDFWIEDFAGNRYWRWSAGRVFTAMLVSRELGGTPWVYQELIPLVDSTGTPLRPGVYMLYARLTAEPSIQNWIAFKVEQPKSN